MYSWVRCVVNGIWFLFSFHYSLGQVIDVKEAENAKGTSITSRVQVLKSRQNMAPGSIILSPDSTFDSIGRDHITFSSFDQNQHWFRFFLRNSERTDKISVFVVGPGNINHAELFKRVNSNWQSIGKTGMKYPYKQRAYEFAHYGVPISIRPATLDTFYLRVDYPQKYKAYTFSLIGQQQLRNMENRFYLLLGIAIGLLLLFFILNLYLFFSLKEIVHLWLAFQIAVMMLTFLANDQLSTQFFGLESEQALRLLPIPAISAIGVGLLIYVLQLFFESPQVKIYKIAEILKWNLFCSAAIYFMISTFPVSAEWEFIFFHWISYSVLAGILSILLICINRISIGFKPAWLLLIGTCFLFIGLFDKLSLINASSYSFPVSLFYIGVILETAISTFVLIYSYRKERKESSKLRREREQLKVDLKKQMLEHKIETQEKVFKSISQELHDNIGQILCIAKLQLTTMDPIRHSDFQSRIQESKELVTRAMEDLDHLSVAASSNSGKELGLLESIKAEVELIKRTMLFKADLTVKGDSFYLTRDKEFAVTRVLQEVFNNIIKHAEANEISVELDFKSDYLAISVKDNGKGFSLESIAANQEKHGLGVSNMRSRIKTVGGDFSIDTSPGKGTVVRVTIPRQET